MEAQREKTMDGAAEGALPGPVGPQEVVVVQMNVFHPLFPSAVSLGPFALFLQLFKVSNREHV